MSQEELNSSAALDSVTDWLERLDDRGDLWQVLVMLTKRKAIGLLRREQAAKRGGGQVRGESALGIPDGMSTAAPGGVEALGRDLFFSAGAPSRANGLRTQFQAKILTQPVNGVRLERRSLTEHEPIKDSRHEAGCLESRIRPSH